MRGGAFWPTRARFRRHRRLAGSASPILRWGSSFCFLKDDLIYKELRVCHGRRARDLNAVAGNDVSAAFRARDAVTAPVVVAVEVSVAPTPPVDFVCLFGQPAQLGDQTKRRWPRRVLKPVQPGLLRFFFLRKIHASYSLSCAIDDIHTV